MPRNFRESDVRRIEGYRQGFCMATGRRLDSNTAFFESGAVARACRNECLRLLASEGENARTTQGFRVGDMVAAFRWNETESRGVNPSRKRKDVLKGLTVGIEIESFFDDVNSMYGARDALRRDGWVDKSDGSLRGAVTREFNSPVMVYDGDMREKIIKGCQSFAINNGRVNRSCGLHVHIGAREFTQENIADILFNYGKIEGLIDEILPPSRRGNNNTYCHSVRRASANLAGVSFVKEKSNRNNVFDVMRAAGIDGRYYKVNLCAYRSHNTIEFRQHSGTVESEKILHWIDLLFAIIRYSVRKGRIQNEWTFSDMLDNLELSDKSWYRMRRENLRG